MYTVLLSVGSIKINEFFENRDDQKRKIKISRIALPVLYILLSLPFLPMVVPVLPVEQLVQYTSALGVDAGVRTENNQLNQLPQHIADRFGWEEMVDQVAGIYDSVRSEIKEETGIITGNWGQAGAIHLFGRKYSLPEPVSLHGWYYFETLRTHEVKDNYLSIGLSRDGLQTIFKEVIPCGIYTHPYCMPYENNKPIYLCRKPKFDLKTYWIIDRNINPRFLETLRGSGVQAVIDYYRKSVEKNPTIPLFTERQINALGYEYLFNGQIEEAIALFQLNVEVFPSSSNVYDSLGEGYMESGQYEPAIFNYQKSLELNPDNSNAVEKLKEINILRNAQ
jgi:hypothetical protein